MKSPVNKQTILIIDDHRMMLNLMGNILEENNFKVYFAEHASEAIGILNTTKIDLILLDIVMPEVDGFQLCEKIKKTVNWKSIPVVFVSSLSDTCDIVRGLEYGVDFIAKPFNRDEFVARIKNQIEIKTTIVQLELQLEELRKSNRYLLGTMHEMSKVMEDARILN